MDNLFTRIKHLWAPPRTKSVGIIPSGGGVPRSIDRQAKAYTTDGYEKNVIVYRCIDIRAKSIASIPYRVGKLNGQGEFVATPAHPVAALLRRPNVVQSWRQFVYALSAYRDITGQAFVERLGSNPTAMPKELWAWAPYNIKVVESAKPLPIPLAWIHDEGRADTRRIWEVDQLDGSCELGIWKTFNPTDKRLGMSVIRAAAAAVDEHNAASEWNARMLNNSCAPDGAFIVEGRLIEEEFDRLKKQITEQYSGPRNARKPPLLEGGISYQQFSLSPKDMDWLNGKNLSAREVAGAFGVPTQVIPIQGDQTFANYEQARLALWEDTVIPNALDFAEFMQDTLRPVVGDFVLEPDLDAVPAIAERRRQVWATVGAAPFLTINEQREAVGYARIEEAEADQLWVPAGKLPLGYEPPPQPDPLPFPAPPGASEDDEEDEEGGKPKPKKPKPGAEDDDK